MSKRTLALAATIIGSGMVVLDGLVVNLALPSIRTSFHAQFSDLQWIIDAYMLFLATLILVGGSLGDIYGRKKMYLTGLYGFTIASVLCGLATGVKSLVALRIVQGIFGALLVPGGLAIINTNFPKSDRGGAIGSWSAWLALVTPLGPLLGGWIISVASWRWIFFINLPLGIVCGYLGSRYFIESRDETSRRLDLKGAAAAIVGFGAITYGLIEGPVRHWSASSLIPLIGGVLSLGLFTYLESIVKDPMVPLRLFRSHNFTGANIMTFLQYGALSGFVFALVIYLQTKLGYSALKAGLSMMPVSLSLLLLSRWFGGLSARVGPRLFIGGGPLICALAIFLLIDYKPGDSYATFLMPRVLLFGIGMAVLVAPLTVTVMASVEETASGIASGINNAVSRLAGLVVIALLGVAGAGNVYRFSLTFCAILAALAGLAAFFIIRNPAAKTR